MSTTDHNPEGEQDLNADAALLERFGATDIRLLDTAVEVCSPPFGRSVFKMQTEISSRLRAPPAASALHR